MLHYQFVLVLRTETHTQTQSPLDQTHTLVCGVCTCERILSAGPSFSPMVLSRCSSVSSGNVSPSMACSRNTWRRHSRFSHRTQHTHTHTLETQTCTSTHTTDKTATLFQNVTFPFWEGGKDGWIFRLQPFTIENPLVEKMLINESTLSTVAKES